MVSLFGGGSGKGLVGEVGVLTAGLAGGRTLGFEDPMVWDHIVQGDCALVIYRSEWSRKNQSVACTYEFERRFAL